MKRRERRKQAILNDAYKAIQTGQNDEALLLVLLASQMVGNVERVKGWS